MALNPEHCPYHPKAGSIKVGLKLELGKYIQRLKCGNKTCHHVWEEDVTENMIANFNG